jgi:hypothetical protein
VRGAGGGAKVPHSKATTPPLCWRSGASGAAFWLCCTFGLLAPWRAKSCAACKGFRFVFSFFRRLGKRLARKSRAKQESKVVLCAGPIARRTNDNLQRHPAFNLESCIVCNYVCVNRTVERLLRKHATNEQKKECRPKTNLASRLPSNHQRHQQNKRTNNLNRDHSELNSTTDVVLSTNIRMSLQPSKPDNSQTKPNHPHTRKTKTRSKLV